MKITVKYLSIVFFLSISVLCISFGQQKAEWKGKIEKRDGITVIKNPKEPIYGEDVFGLEEEITIGEAEGRKDYMFSMIVSIDVDDEGNVYVLDIKERHIKVFNSDGRLMRIIGRKGQGPGEFQRPYTVQVTAQNEVVVFDVMVRKLHFFTLDGEYKKSISLEKLFNQPILNSEGNIVSIVNVDVAENPKYELQKLDVELNPLTFYYSFPKYDLARDGHNSFRSILQWAVTNNNEIVCGHPDEGYELNIFNSEGKIIKNIIKDYTPIKIPAEEIKRATRQKLPPGRFYSVPKYYSPFIWIIVDEDNRIFVCTRERPKNKVGRYWDVFNPEGKFIAKIPISHEVLMERPIIFKENKLYLVEADEEGYQYVKRYKVTWKY
ncbi:MAG: 6-bladed beta-propeller [Promethearchaeota archaeon]